jgi:hypothetical protein
MLLEREFHRSNTMPFMIILPFLPAPKAYDKGESPSIFHVEDFQLSVFASHPTFSA